MHLFFKKSIRVMLLLLLVGILALASFAGTQRATAAVQKKSVYLIKVNRIHNTITVYQKDLLGNYSVPVKAMVCSVGKYNRTKVGTFKTQGKYRWKLLMGHVWGQYSTRIAGGMLFHSVYYYRNNPFSLATYEYNRLGNAASHGCIRLAVQDAKWIYDNCSVGTQVMIYDDKSQPGPLGKPLPIKIPSNVRWDPTDPDKKNPYLKKKPTITGAKSLTVNWGQSINLLQNIRAKSSLGTNITSKIAVNGVLDVNTPGVYSITYTVSDELNKTCSKTIAVTVENNKETPVFTGITDRIAGGNVVIDKAYALTGVQATCAGKILSNDFINVNVTQSDKNQYIITYQASIGAGPVATQTAKIIVDNEPPVINGVADSTLKWGEMLNTTALRKNITLSDNISKPDKISLVISYIQNPDASFVVTYEATDEMGNKAVAQSKILIILNPTNVPTQSVK
jgi:Uncharacterized protein conserved in bacteria